MCQVQMVNAEFFHKLQRKPYPHRMQSLPRVAHRKSRQRLSYENINRRGCLVPVLTHFFPSACTAIALCPEAPATPIQTITQLSKRTHYLTLKVRVQSEWLKIIFTNHIVTRNNLQKPRFAKRYNTSCWYQAQAFKKKKNHKCIQVWKSENVCQGVKGWIALWDESVSGICQSVCLDSSFSTSTFKLLAVNRKCHHFVHPVLFQREAGVCQCWRKIALYIVWLYLCNQSYKR